MGKANPAGAKVDSKYIGTLPDNRIIVFTDGSGGVPSGYGTLIIYPQSGLQHATKHEKLHRKALVCAGNWNAPEIGTVQEICGRVSFTKETNNTAELEAILVGCNAIRELKLEHDLDEITLAAASDSSSRQNDNKEETQQQQQEEHDKIDYSGGVTIMTDSKYAFGQIFGKDNSATNFEEVQATRAAVNALRQCIRPATVTGYIILGNVATAGNFTTDKLASQGKLMPKPTLPIGNEVSSSTSTTSSSGSSEEDQIFQTLLAMEAKQRVLVKEEAKNSKKTNTVATTKKLNIPMKNNHTTMITYDRKEEPPSRLLKHSSLLSPDTLMVSSASSSSTSDKPLSDKEKMQQNKSLAKQRLEQTIKKRKNISNLQFTRPDMMTYR
jgi:ribonuclease HI